jgi:hypothetical protein
MRKKINMLKNIDIDKNKTQTRKRRYRKTVFSPYLDLKVSPRKIH